MTLYEFNKLNKQEQYEVLWEHGVHVSERDDETFTYITYQIFSFYIEVKYNRTDNVIQGNRSFCTDTQLKPYLTRIDISDLIIKN